MGGVKDQIVSHLKTEDYSKSKRVKTEYGSGKKPNKFKKYKNNLKKTTYLKT